MKTKAFILKSRFIFLDIYNEIIKKKKKKKKNSHLASQQHAHNHMLNSRCVTHSINIPQRNRMLQKEDQRQRKG